MEIPVTLDLWKQHLDGKRPLGIVPIMEDATCVWGGIDIDEYNVNLLEVVARVEQLKFPLVACRSKSGGLHLWLFMLEPVAAASMQSGLRSMAAALGFAGSEIFPKQTKFDPKTDKGNWIAMPYLGTTFKGKLKLQYGLKKTAAEMTLEEFVAFAEKRRTSPAQLAELTAAAPAPVRAKAAAVPKEKGPFADGPPCLELMAANGFPEGGRNNALFHLGVFLKKAYPNNWQGMLEADNQKYMQPPLPSEEVVQLKRSLEKKDYQYKCKDQPMLANCDSMACRGRKHGVGGGNSVPIITEWRKIHSENPVWIFRIVGSDGELEIDEIKDITDYRRFTNQCAKQLNLFFGPVKADIWSYMLQDAREKLLTEEQAPADTTRKGRFFELLNNWLTNRARALNRDQLFSDKPWEDEDIGRYEFRINALKAELDRVGMKDATMGELRKWLKDLGGGPLSDKPIKVKGRNIRLWFVPSSKFEADPEMEVSLAPMEPI